jgi:hypothetical protein
MRTEVDGYSHHDVLGVCDTEDWAQGILSFELFMMI